MNTLHWQKNEYGIAAGFQINTPAREGTNLSQANQYLRRAGLHPTPPGASPAADKVKAMAFAVGSEVWKRLGMGTVGRA